MLGNHGLCGLPEEDAHRKSPKCLDGNLGDFGEFCKGLWIFETKTAENLCLGFGCLGKDFFAKVSVCQRIIRPSETQ